MRAKNGNRPLWILLIVVAMLLVGQRVSFERGRIAWRPFGEPRHSFDHATCGIPVHFVLGEVDPRFGFDRPTVSRAIDEAAALWQIAGDAPLFVESDHPQAMNVSLEFDDRQRSANLRRSLRGGIERNREQLASDEALLEHWSERLEETRRNDERASEALAVRVRGHAAALAEWNNADAHYRTEARRQVLEGEGMAIREAMAELERARAEFNGDVTTYNQRALERRRQTEAFRGRIAEYNAHASEDPIESGRYSYDRENGRRIGVFRAADYNELVLILAHEFGHSLGLDHVDAPKAVMHALLHEGGSAQKGRAKPVSLHGADRAAIVSLCGDRLRRRD